MASTVPSKSIYTYPSTRLHASAVGFLTEITSS